MTNLFEDSIRLWVFNESASGFNCKVLEQWLKVLFEFRSIVKEDGDSELAKLCQIVFISKRRIDQGSVHLQSWTIQWLGQWTSCIADYDHISWWSRQFVWLQPYQYMCQLGLHTALYAMVPMILPLWAQDDCTLYFVSWIFDKTYILCKVCELGKSYLAICAPVEEWLWVCCHLDDINTDDTNVVLVYAHKDLGT